MTLSESGSLLGETFATAEEESKTRTSRSSTSGSSNSSINPALDASAKKTEPMNLVLKTRMASKARQNDLSLTATKSTVRTSFSSHATGDFCRIEEEVTVTDDGPVMQQQDLREEDVYKQLSELKIEPAVPNVVVATPSPENRSKNKNTPTTCSTSTSSDKNSAQVPAVDVLPVPSHDSQGSSSDSESVISDITGNFTRASKAPANIVVVEEPSEDFFSQAINNNSAPPYQQEEDFARMSLQRMAAASSENAPARRSVSFSTVCIREYERILGDNPSCSCGPSIGIGWNYDDEDEILTVNEWESWRETEREPERLVLSREEREELLLSLGYNQKVIAQAVREIVKVKNKRRQTITNLGASGVEELLETSVRKVKKLRKGKGILSSLGRKKDKDEDDESIYA